MYCSVHPNAPRRSSLSFCLPPPSALSPTLQFHNFLQSISSYNSILLADDFNCHHLSWGSKHSCPTGESLFNSFTDNNLLVVNTGAITHHNYINPANCSCLLLLPLLTSTLSPLGRLTKTIICQITSLFPSTSGYPLAPAPLLPTGLAITKSLPKVENFFLLVKHAFHRLFPSFR